MPGMISSFKTRVSKIAKLIFFPGSKSRFERNVRRLRDFVFLVLLSVLLWFVTVRTGLDSNVRAPLIVLRPFWLVFLLWSIVLTYLSTKRLVYLLRTEPSFMLFPEMDENWNYIKQELADLGVAPKDLPIILVLGHRPAEGVHYFDHLQLRLRNVRLRTDSEANFQVDLTDSAILVTCQTASLLGAMTRRVDQNIKPYAQSTATILRSGIATESTSKVLGISGVTGQPDELNKPNAGTKKTSDAMLSHSDLDYLSISVEEIELLSAKLKCLCELIGSDREPLCPVNGIVVVVPKEITDSELLTSNAIEMSRIDMKTIREATGLDLPFAVLGTNMHHLKGFGELVKSLDNSSKLRYMGLALHTRIDISADSWMKQIRKGLRWFRQNVLPALVTREMLQLPPSAIGPQASNRGIIIESNHTSYHFLQGVGRQWRHLETFCARISQFQLDQKSVNPRFAGLFLTGLENVEVGPWLFMHEFVKHLLIQQNSISWTPEALARNRTRRRLALLILGLTFAGLVGLVSLVFWIYFR